MFMLPPIIAGGPRDTGCRMMGGPAIEDMMATLLTGGDIDTGTAATAMEGRGGNLGITARRSSWTNKNIQLFDENL